MVATHHTYQVTSDLQKLGDILVAASQLAMNLKPNRIAELKADASWVTNVDREVELFLRKQLTENWGDTSVWGEEFGYEAAGRNGLWLIDPIDGTTNFVFGSPMWGISVALMDANGLEFGGVIFPELGGTLLSQRGRGAWWNGAQLCSNQEKTPFWPPKLAKKAKATGAYVVSGLFVVLNYFGAHVGKGECLYDVAAIVIAIRELGGDATYLDGSAWDEKDLLFPHKLTKPWRVGFPEA
jgi:fructose-1,6-bisphosphatase/inositol monophosphatase family enzyme